MSDPKRARRRSPRGTAMWARAAALLTVLGIVLGAAGPPAPASAPAAAATIATTTAPGAAPAPAPVNAADSAAAPLVVLGVSGVSWVSVRALSAGDDPRLAAAATRVEEYAAANTPVNLVQRGIGNTTCPADGWVTLGAGARARADSSHGGAASACSGGNWADAVRSAHADGYGAEPGALATALDDAGVDYAAVGEGAVLALTTAEGPPATAGSVAQLLTDPAGSRPELILVDLMDSGSRTGSTPGAAADSAPGSRTGSTPGHPADSTDDSAVSPGNETRAAEALTALADALDELSGRARIVVVSVADPQDPSPQIAILPAGATSTRGYDGGLLVGPSTHRPGLIQLTDLAPTLLGAVAGQEAVANSGLSSEALTFPAAASADRTGTSASATAPGSPGSAGRVASLADDAAHAVASERAVIPVSLMLFAIALVAVAAVGVGLRHPRHGSPGRLGGAACWAAALPAGIWLSNLVPWWRTGTWAPMVAALTAAAVAGVMTAVAVLVARALRADGAAALVAAASGPVVILADAAVGAPLGFNGPLGMNAVVAGRFYGVSNTAFALAAGGLLVVLAAGAERFAAGRAPRRPLVAAAVGVPGLLALAVDGAPQLGADVGGALTLIPALVALAAGLAGVRLGLRRWLAVGAVTVGVVGAFAVADYATGSRTHLGGFVSQLLSGGAGATLARKAAALVAPFLTSPLALLALGVGVGVAGAAAWWLRRTARSARAGEGPYAWLATTAPAWLVPTLRALAVLVVVEVLVNDSGLTMLLFSAAAALPALAALLVSTRVGPR
ncbi:hypothetical protein [Actinomyces ruminicola]|uniref:hypothetical protein n=1 Tax=Actinomyces ruminicola TaxID=332524 RepID=UPI00164FCF16|nr:hypothetical protein [Actinomyces ruminicola]